MRGACAALCAPSTADAAEDEWRDGEIWLEGGHDVTVRNNRFCDNIGPGFEISDEDDQKPYGYIPENNILTNNTYGIYIGNFGTARFPPENILRLKNRYTSNNTVRNVWIVP